MARLFPFRSETPSQEGPPRVVELEGEDADAVFSALSSTTARQIYSRLDEEPGTPSDIADAIDSSIQNVRYHLENLEEAGLVEVVDTWYSSRGNEMSVYATTDGPLIVTSDESTGSQLREALSRLLGGIGALAGGSLLVQYGLARWAGASDAGWFSAPGGTDDAADPTAEDLGDAPDDEDDRMGTQDVDEETAEPDSDDVATEDDADTADEAEPDTAEMAEETEDAEDAEDELEADANEYDAADDTADIEADAPADDVTVTGEHAADSPEAVDVLATVPPGLLFFLGGLAVLLAVWCYWYWYRPTY